MGGKSNSESVGGSKRLRLAVNIPEQCMKKAWPDMLRYRDIAAVRRVGLIHPEFPNKCFTHIQLSALQQAVIKAVNKMTDDGRVIQKKKGKDSDGKHDRVATKPPPPQPLPQLSGRTVGGPPTTEEGTLAQSGCENSQANADKPATYQGSFLRSKMSDTGEPGNGDVFEEAERALNIKIPEILKNLLKSCGYENEALIAGMTKATITEIEKFARTDLFQLIDEEDRAKYYGIYSKNPKIYKMLPAHQQVLLWMIEHFKKKRKSHKKEIQASAPREAPTNREGPPKKRSKTSVESSELLSDESQEEELHSENNAREITNQKPVVNRAVNLTDENALIFRNLKKWAKSKAKADLWETLQHKFDDIKIVTSLDQQEMFSKVTCFCNATYKLPKILKPGKKQKSWIYSNFHTHFMTKHFKTQTTSAFDVSTEISARPQQHSITSYLVTNDHENNPILNKKSSKVKILGNVVLSPSRAPASHSTNTLPKKLCDVYLDSRFQSATSTAFGTASGTLSEANSSDPTEDHTGLFEANDRCLDSIDESTNTSSNQLCKIDNQDMDKVPSKWKRQKYQRHERGKLIVFCKNIRIDLEALVVPELTHNLLSVKHINDKGNKVIFEKDRAIIKGKGKTKECKIRAL
ncbi:unnamed protein product [Ceutorhynchus assimilis]|uniref:Uncharacterized protein n=1 Tax=Ceutorhynchus assimilis TaxID=467358 RepID=A0A9N9MTP8_9CUCU|nr:unnamed protein product [Ceutorhynchus assimilis]